MVLKTRSTLFEMLSKFYQKIKLSINRFLNPDNSTKLGACYGVLHGRYVGELFVFIEEDDNVMHFLSIPNMKNREVPVDKYKYGLKSGVIEFVEMLPRNERIVCKEQYKANKK